LRWNFLSGGKKSSKITIRSPGTAIAAF